MGEEMADSTSQSDMLAYTAPPQGIRDLYFGGDSGGGFYPYLNQATQHHGSAWRITL